MSVILKVENAVKRYGSGNVAVCALAGVSFEMQKGEFVAVMGPSGSGKTTLLNVVSTIEPLSGGMITVDGMPVSSRSEAELTTFRRDRLGFVFQDYNLLDTLTVEENIALPLHLKKAPRDEIADSVARVGDALGVKDQFKKFPNELSGGQRQRAACARAVVTSPALVLADEPTGALDSRNSRTLMEQFRFINEKFGSSILMVTHNAEVASYSDRVIFLKDGKIFSEICRGERDRKEFRREIAETAETLGGENDG